MAKVTEQQCVDDAIARKNEDVAADKALDAQVWELLNLDFFVAAEWETAHASIVALVKLHRESRDA